MLVEVMPLVRTWGGALAPRDATVGPEVTMRRLAAVVVVATAAVIGADAQAPEGIYGFSAATVGPITQNTGAMSHASTPSMNVCP